MQSIQPYRKRIRLPKAAYAVHGSAWFVTIGVANRISVFSNADLAGAVAATLVERCAALATLLDLYCLMPDHAHLLVQVRSTSLIDLVGDIKSHSTRMWWEHGGAGHLWQRSFHDRGIRDAGDYERAITYILENPINSHLPVDWQHHPWLGGRLLEHQISQ